MKKLTRKHYEALLMPPKRTRSKKNGKRQRGGMKEVIDVMDEKSPFVRHFPVLALLGSKRVRKRLREAIINELNNNEMKGITEIVNNFLGSRIPVSEGALSKLRKDRLFLHQFLKKNITLKKRKKLLGQKGGALQALIPLAASALSPVISSLVGKLFK